MPIYHLGIDDTDSLKRGCTTYVGALLVERLLPQATFLDFPNLIRLNPNIPWKSRGNAAICLRISTPMDCDYLLELAEEVVEENRDRQDEKNQPGIALLEGGVPKSLKLFGRRALYDVLSVEDATSLARELGIYYRTIKGGRGLVGALAAIGNTLEGDHTYELIVYRKKETWDGQRQVDRESVVEMDQGTYPYTFNNLDYETGRVLITPHGSDPILFGVRGEYPSVLRQALKMLKFSGGEMWVIYRSNQGTDAHLINNSAVAELRPYQAAVLEGKLMGTPKVIRGGHAIAELGDATGRIDIAAYEKSGEIQKVLRELLPGDRVRAYGGVIPHEGQPTRLTLNLEKLEVLELITAVARSPLCGKCKVRMKAKGRNKGYKCEKCGLEAKYSIMESLDRKAKKGVFLPPSRSVRHLTKPLQRYGMEKSWGSDSVHSFFGFIDAKDSP
ncbi:MAG: tRNA(Ile)(2)-agmatinylcytidine synthase [Candidatus Methanosuratincola sp.]|nr:tRNA(Ile)(2)-agmatinylcytidine synthase [Candidatus Methanosuratincola sp.]